MSHFDWLQKQNFFTTLVLSFLTWCFHSFLFLANPWIICFHYFLFLINTPMKLHTYIYLHICITLDASSNLSCLFLFHIYIQLVAIILALIWEFCFPSAYLIMSSFPVILQNVKAVFDAAIKVVLQPPKPKKRRRKPKPCTFL